MNNKELDVREIEAKHKHRMIFEMFNGLKTGESMLIINDHDPKPLHYQLMAENEGEFKWEYVEEGPEVWKVLINKK